MNIMSIDPGLGGGIAFYSGPHKYSAVSMPKTNKEIWDYLNYLKEAHGAFICFIEKVQVWMGDSDEENRGKQFRIAKLMANYNSLVAIIEVNGIPVVEVPPQTWQKELELSFPKKTKQERKNLYKRFAAKGYPALKPTLKTADALCILSFGRRRCALSGSWVKENIRNKETLNLFS